SVAIDLDDRVHDIVLREFDQLLELLKQFTDFRVPLGDPEIRAFPDTVFGKYRGDSFGIVIVITDFAVPGLELLYGLDVFDAGQPAFEIGKIHFQSSLLDAFPSGQCHDGNSRSASAHRAQMQAAPRASGGTRASVSSAIVTSKHQQRVASGLAAMAQAFAAPQSGQRAGSSDWSSCA